jgi:hypothetical protein
MLTIEKVIKLLDDFHFSVFRNHVKNLNIRSYYPLALIDVIDRNIEVVQDSDALCKAIYSENDEKTKKKFFQMAHHTFNLTSFLSRNYPAYLQHNINVVQKLINSNQPDKANVLLKILLDISKKIEDFPTELQACQIMVQQSLLKESLKSALKYQLRVSELINDQNDLNKVYTHFYSFYNIKEKEKSDPETIAGHKAFYTSYFNHNTIGIKIMSRYCYCYFLHYNRLSDFYSDETLELINELENLMQNNETIIFPFLLDLHHRVGYLKLKFWNDKGMMDEVSAYIPELLKNSPVLLYWSSFVNSPEIVILAIQANLFAREHLRLQDINTTNTTLSEEATNQLEEIQNKMQKLLSNTRLQEDYPLRYINLCTINALLSLCGSREKIKEAIQSLNSIFITYQQLTFHSYVDSIYSVLGTAYFKLGDYKKVDTNFKRYKKQLKDQAVHPVNDLTIHAIYYTVMWQTTQKTQYAKKFESVYAQTRDVPMLADLHQNLNQLIESYKIPLDFE